MGTKYIHNTDDATIICKIANEAQKAAGIDTTFVFRNRKVDKSSNSILSTGYTEISEEDLALLEKESKTYNAYKEMGRLTVVDSLPLESMSPEQMTLALKTENAELKKQLAKAQAATGESQQAEIDALNAHVGEQLKAIEALHEELAVKNKELEDAQALIDELQIQLAEETAIDEDKKEDE